MLWMMYMPEVARGLAPAGHETNCEDTEYQDFSNQHPGTWA